MSSPASPVLLVLGAGSNVGLHVARRFKVGGYAVAAVSRAPSDELKETVDLAMVADLADPGVVAGLFERCEKELGIPSVVVYNAWALNPASLSNPLSIPVSALAASLAVNTISAYAAASQAVSGFARLPPTAAATTASRTFIYTGNMQNTQILPATHDLGMGKNASAYFIETAASAYEGKGYRFYYADERTEAGQSVMGGIDGEAHGEFYWGLAEDGKDEKQGKWCQTFVKGVGYKRVEGAVDREVVRFAFPGLD